MIKRRLETKVRESLQRSPSVALVGPRQVGKTTLAYAISKTIPSVYLDLENRLDLENVTKGSGVFFLLSRQSGIP